MSFTSIPILDLSLARDAGAKAAFLADLRHALMEVGFLYLKNVGIEDELFEKVMTLGRAFFDIPMEEKYARKLPCRDALFLCDGFTSGLAHVVPSTSHTTKQ
jgi:isopenicillin N synthase-like dioxygenase